MNKYKILVVESTEVGRVLLESLLKEYAEIFFAFNGEEALKLICDHNGDFDLMILDFLMKDLNCFSVLKELNNKELPRKIPIVVVTENTSTASEALKGYDIEDIIYKPLYSSLITKRIINIIKSYKFDSNERNLDIKSLITYTDLEVNDNYAFPINEIPKEFSPTLNPENFYDFYRIVNPKNHRIYRFKDGKVFASKNTCYYIWNRNKPCVACVSKKACSLNRDFRKIERYGNRFFSVIAVPFCIDKVEYSVELIRDLTSSLLFSDGNTDSTYSMEEFFEQHNNLGDRDSFTKLHSKTFINQQISEYLENNIDITIAFLDINYFKNINDTFGHVHGDEVLLFLAQILLSLEDTGKYQCARVGGDEFIIMTKSTNNNLLNIVDDIKESLRKHIFETGKEKFNVSFAYGIANSNKDDTLETLIDRADKKMYIDKSINK